MSDFRFSLDELMKGDPAVFSREINKQLNNPNVPLKTSASILGGNENFLSTLSVGQILMGMPATNSQQDVFSMLDTAMTTITSGLQAAANDLKKVVSPFATAFDYLLPGDIAKDAIDWVTNPAVKHSTPGSGQGTGNAGGDNQTSQINFNGQPTNQDFLAQCRRQFGKTYTTSNPQRFGPNQFDCSGFVYAALRAIGLKSPSVPTVSGTQYAWCRDDPNRKGGGAITVDQAIRTPGALIFAGTNASEHVAVSVGDGKTDYAAHQPGVLSGPSNIGTGFFTLAGLIPGLYYIGIDSGPLDSLHVQGPQGAQSPHGNTPQGPQGPQG